MKALRSTALLLLAFVGFSGNANSQTDDICSEFGVTPSLDNPLARIPYIYGRIHVKAYGPVGKFPKIVISLLESQQSPQRLTVERSGHYCFKRQASSAATLIVEIDGVEVARRSLISFAPAQQREDFEVTTRGDASTELAPGAVSAKFARPPNPKTEELYRRAAAAEKGKDLKQAALILQAIVNEDPDDFLGWAKLGLLYFESKDLAEAETAFRRSLAIRIDYPVPWVNMGLIRYSQKQYEAAAEILKHASTLEPNSARIYNYLGESYLQAKMGSLGAEALNNALRLDPIGMAECHLRLAHLYQLAKAEHLASREYRLFLEKRPDHKDRKKFERFIKEHPEKPVEN